MSQSEKLTPAGRQRREAGCDVTLHREVAFWCCCCERCRALRREETAQATQESQVRDAKHVLYGTCWDPECWICRVPAPPSPRRITPGKLPRPSPRGSVAGAIAEARAGTQ